MSDFKYNLDPTEFIKRGPAKLLEALENNMDEVRRYAAQRIAEEVVSLAREYLEDGRGTAWDPLYYKGPKLGESTPKWNKEQRRARRDDKQPLYDEGTLAHSIKVFEVNSNHAVVGSDDEKALLHEFGGQNRLRDKTGKRLNPIPARPFMTPAILNVKYDTFFKKALKEELMAIIEGAMTGKKKSPRKNSRKGKK